MTLAISIGLVFGDLGVSPSSATSVLCNCGQGMSPLWPQCSCVYSKGEGGYISLRRSVSQCSFLPPGAQLTVSPLSCPSWAPTFLAHSSSPLSSDLCSQLGHHLLRGVCPDFSSSGAPVFLCTPTLGCACTLSTGLGCTRTCAPCLAQRRPQDIGVK